MVQSPVYWLWLAAASMLVWLVPVTLRASFLAVAGFGYLASVDIPLACLVAVWSLLFFAAGRLDPATQGPQRKRLLRLLIGLSLLQLVWFKLWLTGSAGNAVGAAGATGGKEHWILPLGVSYFTFKFIHYALEMSRRTLKPHSWADFASYMALPPIFTAGPIERFDHFLANRASQWSPQLFAEGATRIVHGLVKKFVIAAMLEPSGDSIASQSQLLEMLPDIPTIRVWRYLFRTFLLFYLDFSAYSDVAIGGARLLGVGIQENFDWPILAPNIGAFWKRWHMTLAGWCQSYIYMPLIGKTRNPYVATYLAFLGIGLWHGPTLGWLLWGAWHGTGVAAYVYWTQLKKRRRWVVPANIATRVLSTGLTLAFVSTASVLPAVRNVQDLFGVLRILAKMVFVDV